MYEYIFESVILHLRRKNVEDVFCTSSKKPRNYVIIIEDVLNFICLRKHDFHGLYGRIVGRGLAPARVAEHPTKFDDHTEFEQLMSLTYRTDLR